MSNLGDMKKEDYWRKEPKQNRLGGIWLVIIVVFVIVALSLLVFSSKIPGLINSLFGKDILVKVDMNKQDFFLKHQEKEDINFKISIQGNSFCKAECNYRFNDISRNETIKEENFTLDLIPRTVNFTLEPKRLGKGQELYRLDLKCKGVYSTLCQITEKENIQNILISLQYDLNDDEKLLKENSLQKLNLLRVNLNSWHSDLIYFNESINELNKSALIDEIIYDKSSLEESIIELDDKLEKLKLLWKKQDYFILNESLGSEEIFFNYFKKDIIEFNKTVEDNLYLFNSILEKLNLSRNMLNEMRSALILNETNFSRYLEVNETISDFNSKLKTIQARNSIELKNMLSKEIFNKTLELYHDFKNQTSNITIPEGVYNNLSKINFKKIEFLKQDYNLGVSFDEPNEECCVFNDCNDCCLGGSCLEKEENLPIVFVHGHDFSKYASAENSLYQLDKIQDKLEQAGFLNAGAISMNSKTGDYGVWGKANIPITVKLSYYLDLKNNSGEYVLTSFKNENITAYANRLKNLIDIVKYKTGKQKVVIVAYSMGGLVSRKYIQLYGQDSVSKLILVAVPNKGIVGEISSFCPVLGESKECDDMEVNSTFMQELAQANNLTIPNYAIIGTGCTMLNGKGDGIVLEKNAKLEGATTFTIKGDCSGGFLHTKINDPKLYPKAYGIIKEILEGEA